jgi:hypothetical protein
MRVYECSGVVIAPGCVANLCAIAEAGDNLVICDEFGACSSSDGSVAMMVLLGSAPISE